MTGTNHNGLVFYFGPSALVPGRDVVAIVTGFHRTTSNPKTGNMLQLWILTADQTPHLARAENRDSPMCGDCPIKRACYVKWHQAPRQVWECWWTGGYRRATDHDFQLLADRKIRLGAAGDPCALPYRLVSRLCRSSDGWTGYTHQWQQRRFWRFKHFVMASVENQADARLAQYLGWRTFRATSPNAEPMDGEISCPASEEMGHRTTCEQCGLCQGANTAARNIRIVAHGGKASVNAALAIVE